jgi:general secretion pathway protein C
MNWPLWGGLLATLLLAKHAWVLFAPAEHAIPATTNATGSAQAEQLFGTVTAASSSASLNGIRPIGIFAHRDAGFAVLQTGQGQVGVALGKEVMPGIVLAETHADHVVLERNGVRHRVDLDKAPAAAGITPVRGDPASAAQIQMLNRLTPEQQKVLLQQQQGLIRGRP